MSSKITRGFMRYLCVVLTIQACVYLVHASKLSTYIGDRNLTEISYNDRHGKRINTSLPFMFKQEKSLYANTFTFNGTISCLESCYLLEKEELLCDQLKKHAYINYTSISCNHDVNTQEISIGEKNSIRRIKVKGLESFAKTKFWHKLETKQLLKLHLQLNILELTEQAFVGLENILEELTIVNVINIHPDTFFKLKMLTSIRIGSKKKPELFVDYLQKSTQSIHESSASKIPTFLRFSPADQSTPLSINFDIRCHRCLNYSSQLDPIIVVFNLEASGKKGSVELDSLSVVHADNCPRLLKGLGCPMIDPLKNVTDLKAFIISPVASTAWYIDRNSDNLNSSTAEVHEKNYTLVILLVIWCTFLTFFLLILGIFFARNKIKCLKSILPQKFEENLRNHSLLTMHIIEPNIGSCEELNRLSANGSLYNSLVRKKDSISSSIFMQSDAYLNRDQPYCQVDNQIYSSLHNVRLRDTPARCHLTSFSGKPCTYSLHSANIKGGEPVLIGYNQLSSIPQSYRNTTLPRINSHFPQRSKEMNALTGHNLQKHVVNDEYNAKLPPLPKPKPKQALQQYERSHNGIFKLT